ncbi:MAG: 16S rRNA (uracil(1498)-N(3))-methyltransferase [Parcubacteria group bacterium]|nr:16S rRNA (uracil(1498)-N(3))-methyltransferase [Parcubacteria group bacterium]
MRVPRFFVSFALHEDRIEIRDGDIVHQIVRVLRMHDGQELILCNGDGNDVRVWILGSTKDIVTVEVIGREKNENELVNSVVLYCSILKRENFEWVAQKATEIGVKEIVPLVTQHTVKLELKEERLKKIIQEAAEQSGRSVLPKLQIPMGFEQAMNEAKLNGVTLFFDITGKVFDKKLMKGEQKINIFIGPEGGWSEEEVETAKKNKFIFVNLGKLTLRAETAAIVSTYLVSQAY